MKIILSLILISVLLNTLGQLLFKLGMNQIGEFSFSWANLAPISCKLGTNPRIIIGLLVYFMSTLVWFLVLSRAEMSFAYPLISMGYIFNAITAYYFLHEAAFSPMRLLGTLAIMIGVALICQS